MSVDEARRLVAEVPHWHHAFEIFPGIVTPGTYDPSLLLDKMQLPAELTGLRVLDIGTSDGFFALQMARRGAEVVAIDYREKHDHGYYVTERLNDLKIDYHLMNVYDLPNRELGLFDIVIVLGVLYHLPDMIRALHMIRQSCRGILYLETHSDNEFCPEFSAARYYRAATLSNDHTNFWSPNRLCVRDMLHDTGFDIEQDEAWDDRLFVKAKAVPMLALRGEKIRLGYGLVSPLASP
jgi:tRNA (mo5U34)-methyltransferase